MMDMRHFAKILVDSGNACGHARQDFEEEIVKRAERRGGESAAQAFTRFVTTDATGKLLFKAAMMAPPRQAPQDFPLPKKPESAGPASAELDRLARQMAKDKGLSFQQAFVRIYENADTDTDPERAELVRRVKIEEREATRRVAESRWPITSAVREFSR
jgi:hypothetical protein